MQSDSKKMFSAKFGFAAEAQSAGFIPVSRNCVYGEEIGYGFVTDSKQCLGENWEIPEINNGFVPAETPLPEGVQPCYFRIRVPHSGNYKVSVVIACTGKTDVKLFSERRRFVLKKEALEQGSILQHTFTANVCEIIPTGKKQAYQDKAVDLTLAAEHAEFQSITVEETENAVTVFLAGDSTVTDQQADVPYVPAKSYCGWGQMLPLFFNSGAAVSNHAHSGFTTEDFLKGGHWEIIKKVLHPGDYVLIQFGHNDEKIPHLAAFGGYTRNVERLIDETRENGGVPVLVTSVSRNLWNAPEGGFNDLLEDWAQACRVTATKKQVALIDLHEATKRFFYAQGCTHGMDYCKKYFYPGDYTHFNDIGGFLIASFVVSEMHRVCPENLVKYLRDLPESIEGHDKGCIQSFETDFADIKGIPEQKAIEQLTAKGIMRNKGHHFHPDASYSRAEFLASAFTAFIYLPKTVWNSACTDIHGDEWYAGNVQAAFDNGFIDGAMISGGKFEPEAPISEFDALSILAHIFLDKFELHKRCTALHCAVTPEDLKSMDRTDRVAAAAEAVHLESWVSERVLSRARAAALLKRAMDEVR